MIRDVKCGKCSSDNWRKRLDTKGYRCRSCDKVYKANYQVVNKEEIAAKKLVYREPRRKEISKAQRKYQKNNRPKYNSYKAKYRAAKLQATPSWVNEGYIKLFYEGAKLEEARTDKKVHVDHIVPLQSKLVCGLHCEDNLQLLFLKDNMAKGNRHWPDPNTGKKTCD